jgi:hypothetical protein
MTTFISLSHYLILYVIVKEGLIGIAVIKTFWTRISRITRTNTDFKKIYP